MKQFTKQQSDAMFRAGIILADVGLSFDDCSLEERMIASKNIQLSGVIGSSDACTYDDHACRIYRFCGEKCKQRQMNKGI